MSFMQWVLMLAIMAICALLVLVILIQRGRGGGLAGAFGGAGGSSAFGAKTGDVFTGITVAFAFVYLLLNVFANYAFVYEPPPAAAQSPVAQTIPVSTSSPAAVPVQSGSREAATPEAAEPAEEGASAPPESAPTEDATPPAADPVSPSESVPDTADPSAGQPVKEPQTP